MFDYEDFQGLRDKTIKKTHFVMIEAFCKCCSTVALRTDLEGDPTFSNLLDRVKRGTMAAFAHAEAPFSKVVEALKARRSAAYNPVYQVQTT